MHMLEGGRTQLPSCQPSETGCVPCIPHAPPARILGAITNTPLCPATPAPRSQLENRSQPGLHCHLRQRWHARHQRRHTQPGDVRPHVPRSCLLWCAKIAAQQPCRCRCSATVHAHGTLRMSRHSATGPTRVLCLRSSGCARLPNPASCPPAHHLLANRVPTPRPRPFLWQACGARPIRSASSS